MTNEQIFTGAVVKQTDSREYTRKDGTQGMIATFLFEEKQLDRPQQKLVRMWDKATIEWLRAHVGEEVTVRFDTSVREYNGRYYEDANARFVVWDGKNVRDIVQAQQQAQPQAQPAQPPLREGESDELPF